MESHLENNKYYVPEISEFHIGFEYYLKDIKGNPLECKEVLKSNLMILDTKQTLVKYLDQFDIESLGWTFKTKGPFRTWYTGSDSWFNNTIPTGDSGRYWSFELSHDIKYNGIIIKAGTNYGDTDTFFEGTIKNKSELIKLMQQLNIK